ncbi:hypothetical protein LJR074_003668 [Acidovorax sp. LjRoot74]|uniref:hypothetical protein n=1 Tax=Acidovorax sp. LjRoot74 TaxID=3342337 RepID=UPI003ECEEE56
MNILLPKTITAAMFQAGTTIPAVDTAAGEVAWVSGTNYVAGNRRVDGDYIYECVKDVNTSPQNTYAPSDIRSSGWWLKDEGAPTNRMAPFDKYLFTKARKATSLTYVIRPGFVTGLAIYGLEADRLAITVKDGGTDLVPPIAIDLWQQAIGEWEYLFGELQRGTYFTLKDLPLRPNVEISITVSRNTPGVEAAVGFISFGVWKRLLAPKKSISGAQYGMESETKDYSYVKDNDDGTYIEKLGRKSTNIGLTCVIDAEQAPAAQALLDQILGKAVAVEVSNLPRYSHLATVAKVTGKIRSTSWEVADVSLTLKGNV